MAWAHPDAAWSPLSYGAPQGVDDEPCRHSVSRSRIGPTGRQTFGFAADTCGKCGRITRGFAMSWRAYFWARRFNARLTCPTPSSQERKRDG